ncbi:LOW QUALITY PROTEIN: hypothetical protein U9M48_000901 [Paspalum notatum var. saurae]|uniref:non-specific serine/threonine protein kinase n=1 Tax=Paspalum notatum var. saurae TaxID=547442 RepID=A0AAQ3PIN4_PASNO
MHVLLSEDARLPALPPRMYGTMSEFGVSGSTYRGALSIEYESYSGDSSSTKTGESKVSSGSSRDQDSTYSVGRAKYVYPVPHWDGATGEMASFITTFSFGITLDPSTSIPGDGMAFFLGHFQSNIPPESGGGSLGLVTGGFTNGTDNSAVVAVEFDTFLNPAHASKHRPSRVAVVVISVLVSLLLLLMSALGFLLWKKCNGRRSRVPHGTTEHSDCEEQDDIQSRVDLERGVAASGPRRYTFRELAAAIDNCAEDGKLGRGGFGSVGFGSVYRGGQDVERPVAIKVFSSESSAQGRREFEAEVRIISRLKHRNLVQLLGWCDSRSGLLLVYELVAGGSLDRHLHSRDTLLTWPERYQIILGLGSALRYLHQEWEQCVVHGDIKPSNIMLDEWHGAKLGDFGLAQLGDHGARWQTTKAVLSTAHYYTSLLSAPQNTTGAVSIKSCSCCSQGGPHERTCVVVAGYGPEFVNTRHPSTESNIYSFGIVLLEVVSGRAPVVLPEPGGGRPPFVLLKWVWGLYGRNAILDAADEWIRGGGEVDDRCMEHALVVGLWRAHPEQSERPSISQAMHVLQSEDARLPALPLRMYGTMSYFADSRRGALSIVFDKNRRLEEPPPGASVISLPSARTASPATLPAPEPPQIAADPPCPSSPTRIHPAPLLRRPRTGDGHRFRWPCRLVRLWPSAKLGRWLQESRATTKLALSPGRRRGQIPIGWIDRGRARNLRAPADLYLATPTEKFRFSKEFIELRRQALDLFVNRIASHPELKQSDVLRTFLINELQADSKEATKKFEHIVRLMNEELARFQEQKIADIGLAFHEFAKGLAKLAKDIADAWRSVLPKLEACSTS